MIIRKVLLKTHNLNFGKICMFHYFIQQGGFAQDIWKDLSSTIRTGSFEWVRRESSGLEPYFLRVCVGVA